MNKTKVIILLLFLFISLVFALEWRLIIEAVNKAYKIVGLKTPTYLLTIIEKESGFGKNLGRNLGSKEKNLKACVKYCDYLKNQDPPINGTKCYSPEARSEWCHQQYSALEKITSNLGLDINKVPFSPDFGIGYTQFQPTTWLQYKELQNKNPWNLEDSLYAAALKLKYDGINENEAKAIEKYNPNPTYFTDYQNKRQEWDQILDDTIFVYDCSKNDFSCALSIIKTNYPECTENDWSIKKKKECIKTKLAEQKEKKLAELEIRKNFLETSIKATSVKYTNSTPAYIVLKSHTKVKENKDLTLENKKQTSLENQTQNQSLNQNQNISNQNVQFYSYEVYKKPKNQRKNKENQNSSNITNITNLSNEISKALTNSIKNLSTSTQGVFDKDLQQDKIKQENNNQPVNLNYIGGGSFSNLNRKKDPCDDYKNKNYPKIIINEIQFETNDNNKDEFIELYNPNSEEIDLTCWSLEKYASKQNPTSTPSLIPLIPSLKFKGKIKPYGYFLITSSSTKEKYQGDLSYAESYSIANNNVIILKKPNGEISDLVGYGNDEEKIYQYENSPFIFQNLENKSIQRKNFQDTNNNLKDFWLRQPSPKNSLFTDFPRDDFVDLSEITFQNFDVKISTSSDGKFFEINFSLNTDQNFSSNYYFEIKVSTSSNLSDLSLFNYPTSTFFLISSTTDYSIKIPFEDCLSSSIKFFVFIKDFVDYENQISTSTEVSFPENLCFQNEVAECQIIDHSQDNFEEAKKEGKILISKVKVVEGVNNNKGEFIELYNPNEFPIDLSGFYIKKITREGNYSDVKIVAPTKIRAVIQPFSYFLIVNRDTCGTLNISIDYVYPTSSNYGLTYNNGLALFNDKDELVDYLCWGHVENFSCLENPPEDKVIERKKINYEEALSQQELENLGHGYIAFDDDYNYLVRETFVFSDSAPYNSQITKEVFKIINKQNLELKNYPTTYTLISFDNNIKEVKEIFYHQFELILSWLSPAYYETSSIFYTLNHSYLEETKFKPLTFNSLKIDLNPSDLFSNLIYMINLSLYKESSENLGEETEISSTTLSYEFLGYNFNPEIPLKEIKLFEDENGKVRKISFENNFKDYQIINLKVIERREENQGFDNLKIKVKSEEGEKILNFKYKEIGDKICGNEYNFAYYEFYRDEYENYFLESQKIYEFEIIEPENVYLFIKCENNDYLFKIYGGNMIFSE